MKIIIVGGVAGGAAVAARLRRLNEGAEITIYERGEYISFANCGLPYYAGDVITNRELLLVQTPKKFKDRFNVDIQIQCVVESIDREKKTVLVKNLKNQSQILKEYDFLILSPGAEPFVPNFEGSDLPCVHTVRTVPDIDQIKEKLGVGNINSAVVVGGGFIGIEMAENIRKRGVEVSLIELLDQVMPPYDKEMTVLLRKEMERKGVKVFLKEQVVKVQEKGASFSVITDAGTSLSAEMVIMSVGIRPETELARSAGLEIGNRGILTNNKMQTSDPFIYAVGDAVENKDFVTGVSMNLPLAGPATKQARVVANEINGMEDEYDGHIGTSILKVFDLTAAMTGSSEKVLKKAGIPFEKVYLFPCDHATYYPGASQLSIKCLFSPNDGRVLGAQIVGKNGVDRRIDILAVAIKHEMTVKDLSKLELCYAPPYGSAKDPINCIGTIAVNHLTGLSPLTHWDSLSGKEFLLDVRTENEVKQEDVPSAMNIPVDELREHLDRIPKGSEIAVFCAVGIRAHIAVRILSQKGFSVKNISGGCSSRRLLNDEWVDTCFCG